MKKEFFNTKNIIIMIAIVVVIAATIALVVINPFGKKKDRNIDTNEIKEITKIESKEDLIDVIVSVSNKYYQDYYFNLVDKDDLEKHTEFGINISLKSIGLAMGFSDDLIENLEKYECDQDNTKIHFYPTSPFKKTDYTIKTEIVCNK